MGVQGVHKPAGEPCAFMTPGGGCDVYATRPKECAHWRCGWLSEEAVPGHDPALRPDVAHALFTRAGDGENWLLLEDPAYPGVGREAYAAAMREHVAKPSAWVLVVCGPDAWILGSRTAYYAARRKLAWEQTILGIGRAFGGEPVMTMAAALTK